ncbi:hypothetical protein ElyMa_006499200 [Elysia marginata]|uniref:Uncharacterized protein n=1 Tax=Elysia marginata TaxID=1093978 RepID=A0AAV4I667_9GAST|nr:hypothetical protein ElyMa_006499200 [Elysia marginata]
MQLMDRIWPVVTSASSFAISLPITIKLIAHNRVMPSCIVVLGSGAKSCRRKAAVKCAYLNYEEDLAVFEQLDFMRYGLAEEDEAHSGENPRWLVS